MKEEWTNSGQKWDTDMPALKEFHVTRKGRIVISRGREGYDVWGQMIFCKIMKYTDSELLFTHSITKVNVDFMAILT